MNWEWNFFLLPKIHAINLNVNVKYLISRIIFENVRFCHLLILHCTKNYYTNNLVTLTQKTLFAIYSLKKYYY